VEPAKIADNEADELTFLRSKLAELYPHQAQEINSSGLLQSHVYPFVDTNSTNTLLRAHRQLVRLRTMDTILQNAQRQGRISFYMTCTGEEAIHMGAASALDNQDPIFAQYREQGLLMWRGFTLEQFTNQCFSNDLDLGKGRQMPIHYGSRALNYHTVSSPLGTQLPQAVGAAYRLKLMKKPNVAICFFGDGCASTTDFHAALNFAATLSAPVIFFCRNNGYAISTPVSDQYAGDGIVSRATGYGMAAIRVDGNDIFAVHAAVRGAKKYALQHNAPVLIEGMTYRLGHHSTSDDSTRYRSEDEVDTFAENMDPLNRLQLFLKHHELLTDEDLTSMKEEERVAVLDAIKKAENRAPPSMESMFEDVYKEMPAQLVKQMQELKDHLAKYPDKR
jgi:2-oxoisovalerate dehydrogenase E1 component alpha subunit